MTKTLIDAGPLVAILSDRDAHHQVCLDTLKTLRKPLVTTWPVLAEVTYLVRKDPNSLQTLFNLIVSKTLQLFPLDESSLPWIAQFFEKYQDQDPQLADASLVYVAGQINTNAVFTLDRRHFSVFRLANNASFELVPAAY